jgi:arginyl-tRNA synthetase
MLQIDPAKKIVFDMKEWLRLDGESGPYVQYTFARISSMLVKMGSPVSQALKIEDSKEKDLVALLMIFNQVVQQATEQYKPSVLTAYLYDLSRAFNGFYADCPVGSSEEPIKSSRLILSKAVGNTLKQGLALLGIEAPEKM